MTGATTATALLAVYTTVASRDDAQRIARALVERRLAACAQIEAIESVYRWDGALQQATEFRLLLKTTAAQYPAVEAAIRAMHPYTLPAIHALALEAVYPPYADWVRAESSGEAAGSATDPAP